MSGMQIAYDLSSPFHTVFSKLQNERKRYKALRTAFVCKAL